MIRIALVEDEAEVRAQLQGYVQRHTRQYGTEFAVTEFADGMELLDDYRPVYDILFLDVEMKHLDGMETAGASGNWTGCDARVHHQHGAVCHQRLCGGGAGLRPQAGAVLCVFAAAAKGRGAAAPPHPALSGGAGGGRPAAAGYLAHLLHRKRRPSVHFYTEEGDFAAPGALKALEEKLADRPFARCNSGYLVNLAQVQAVQQNTVEVGPYELQVSRPKRKSFLAALTDYIGGDGL